jgi:hypothetical protein
LRAHIAVGDQVGLGDQDPVGEAHLLLRLLELVELVGGVLRVDQRDHRIEQVVLADVVVHEERLGHRSRIGHAGGFDDHALEADLARLALLLEVAEDADQVAAHGAAQAAVVHLDDLLAGRLEEEVVVDALLAELVLDHRDPVPVLLAQDAVEERRLAAPEKARQDRDGHHLFLSQCLLLNLSLKRARRSGP